MIAAILKGGIVFCATALLLFASTHAFTPKEIFNRNAPAVVYLEVRRVSEPSSGAVDRGTGFVVSHDGYMLTAAHLKPGSNEFLEGIIGQRQGVSYRLTHIETDDQNDIALWRFPQSLACRRTVALSSKNLEVFDRLVVLGFPGSSGLTPNGTVVSNLFGPKGFLEADGNLEGGTSGAPAFNEADSVAAIVHGGRSVGTRSNNLIPVAPARDLLRKHNVKFSVDSPEQLPIECYSSCRTHENGVERWGSTKPWRKNSGWLGGGNNQRGVCNGLKAAELASMSNSEIELKKTWEDSKKDVLGHVEYRYFCAGLLRSDPVYKETRSRACGLWSQ